MMEISNNEMLVPNRELALKAFRPAKRCIKSYLVCGDIDFQKDVA